MAMLKNQGVFHDFINYSRCVVSVQQKGILHRAKGLQSYIQPSKKDCWKLKMLRWIQNKGV